MGVLVAAYAFFAEKPQGIGRAFRGSFGEFVVLGVVWAVGILFGEEHKCETKIACSYKMNMRKNVLVA